VDDLRRSKIANADLKEVPLAEIKCLLPNIRKCFLAQGVQANLAKLKSDLSLAVTRSIFDSDILTAPIANHLKL